MKDDILKSIQKTDEGEVSRVLKEGVLESEAAGVLEASILSSRAASPR